MYNTVLYCTVYVYSYTLRSVQPIFFFLFFLFFIFFRRLPNGNYSFSTPYNSSTAAYSSSSHSLQPASPREKLNHHKPFVTLSQPQVYQLIPIPIPIPVLSCPVLLFPQPCQSVGISPSPLLFVPGLFSSHHHHHTSFPLSVVVISVFGLAICVCSAHTGPEPTLQVHLHDTQLVIPVMQKKNRKEKKKRTKPSICFFVSSG